MTTISIPIREQAGSCEISPISEETAAIFAAMDRLECTKLRGLEKVLLILSVLFGISLQGQAQAFFPKSTTHNGEAFISWGWNKSAFADSDIRFKGTNYDFTVANVQADDRPTSFSFGEYFSPTTFTLPQTNLKVGYFISDHYAVTLAFDHMKYVVSNDQYVEIDGYIDMEESAYNGEYYGEEIFLHHRFIRFEHTDGLNYWNVGLSRWDDVFYIEKIKTTLSITEGAGAGILYPRTNSMILGKERHDKFHVSGYGVDLHVGLNLNIFKYFFLQLDAKGGFIHMPWIRTTDSRDDEALQHFTFISGAFSFGAQFPLVKSKKASPETE